MGLIRAFLLLAIVAASSHACIPTKTPEKRIPATPGGPSGPKTCPTLTKWTNCVVQTFTCSDAIISPTSVTCASGSHMIVFRTDDPNAAFQTPGILECKGTDWILSNNGKTLLDHTNGLASTGTVACII